MYVPNYISLLVEIILHAFTFEICTEPGLPKEYFVNKNYCTHSFLPKMHCQIHISQTANIKCPGLECGHLLDPVSCKPIIISPALFVKWSDLLCETYVLKWGRTYCPCRVCSELIVNESGGTVKKSKCPNCSKEIWMVCWLSVRWDWRNKRYEWCSLEAACKK